MAARGDPIDHLRTPTFREQRRGGRPGACYHRLLMPAEPLTTGFADRLLDNLFGGIAAPGREPAGG